ncbi:MAG: vancomycin resistance protein [Candidatus Taylorbacteria bacterium]|nr:vancomycin resistance protein [Candidatus Taylorbacteria bacterium]
MISTLKLPMNEIAKKHITAYERPKRKALSSRFPILLKPIIFTKRSLRKVKNKLTLKNLKQKDTFLTSVIARHSSPLFRKLGDSDTELQKNKVINLKQAISKLNGIVIPPGETFSLFNVIGSTTKKYGYVEGMLLSNGKVSRGFGGGLCQLSNFLFWILSHTDSVVVERYHHSVDAFPDSGRTLPFGSGATILNNFIDLKIKNTSKSPIQLRLWLTDLSLKGQVLAEGHQEKKFHLRENNHTFIKRNERYFRYNEIYRDSYIKGEKIGEEKLFTNFAPVIYPVTKEYLEERGYLLFEYKD